MIKKIRSHKDEDWFLFASFLSFSLYSDYIAFRFLVFLEPYTLIFTTMQLIPNIMEKSFKLLISFKEKPDNPSKFFKSFGHNIDILRKKCSEYNLVFLNTDIEDLTKNFNDKSGKFQQYLKYGSEESIEGFSAQIEKIIQVIDKIVFESIYSLPKNEKMLLVFSSLIKNLITKSRFDQSKNQELLIKAIKDKNIYFDDFLRYCHNLDDEHNNFLESIKN